MATSTIRSRATPRRKEIPVREIGDADLRFALREGWEDFKDMRGDIFFAGLIYTLIGLAAVGMTASRSFIPFFLPVVAGVGLLGPLSAIGFYELARRREDGKEVHWYNFVDVRKRPSADDMPPPPPRPPRSPPPAPNIAASLLKPPIFLRRFIAVDIS